MRISTVDRLLGEYTYKAFGILKASKADQLILPLPDRNICSITDAGRCNV